MKKERIDRKKRNYYLITVFLGIGLVIFALLHRGLGGNISTLQGFCDAFLVAGAALFGLWLLALVWYKGGMDLPLYTAALMFSFAHRESKDRERKDFNDYREGKKLERREPNHLLHISIVFLVVAVLLYGILKLAQ